MLPHINRHRKKLHIFGLKFSARPDIVSPQSLKKFF